METDRLPYTLVDPAKWKISKRKKAWLQQGCPDHPDFVKCFLLPSDRSTMQGLWINVQGV